MFKYITIHGHFYQPPRENPYLEKIETQESAYPYHDWNERINEECYRPNTCSRVLTSKGKIEDIINNYEYLSFNIGPTLLGWMEENDKEAYQKIIEADVKSRTRNNGHGNAIAQVYNHIIMPLASYRDKVTQIRWGIDDFKRHFGREPEGMWLAETAINLETVKALIENGIKYTVLSPFQAEKVRLFFSNTWSNVEDGSIDPTQPYRVYIDEDKTKYLDVFFYDAPISTAVSFEHILKDASSFAQRFSLAAHSKEGRPTLINIATDGESYGHHEPFGDMCLAYFFKNLANEYKFSIINYGYFLEMYGPVYEVVLKAGENGEGTAWSCAHGVGRWKEDCGCSTYAGHGWNQRWRKPLRDGLNALRDKLWDIFVVHSKDLLKDSLEARNDYYNSFSGAVSEEDYFKKHLKGKNISAEDRVKLLTLLESQRFSQLMFTSCGWFFADISGIETVQIIKYANIAIHYAGKYSKENLEELLLSYLHLAYSNVGPEYNGDVIYNKWIKPYVLDEFKAANQYIVEGELFDKLETRDIYLFKVAPKEILKINDNEQTYTVANLTLEHTKIKVKKDVSVVIHHKDHQFQTYLRAGLSPDLEKLTADLKALDTNRKKEELLIKSFPYQRNMNDLNFEASVKIMDFLWEKQYALLIHSLDKLFLNFKDLIQATSYMGGFLPLEIKSLVEIVMSAKYFEELRKIDDFKIENITNIKDVVEMAKKLKLFVKKDRSKRYLEKYLSHLMEKIKDSANKEDISKTNNFLESLDKMDISISKTHAENVIFDLYKTVRNNVKTIKNPKDITKLAQMLNINVELV